jgi:hypothetical protein
MRDCNGYISIGSEEVIARRDRARVDCYPGTVVNDYVPFYFSFRTPMLYNIVTGHGVPRQPQASIIYLCCNFMDLISSELVWCYTNGNAASAITRFFTEVENIETNLDWHSIRTTDFRDNNADGDEDRMRKKHSEFLVRNHVPVHFIKAIVVLNESAKGEVETILENLGLNIRVLINRNYYFV